MPREFKEAPDVKDIAETKVIPTWLPHLQNVDILYLYTTEMKSHGKIVLAQMKKMGGLTQYFSQADFTMLVDEEQWDLMDQDTKLALVHHELCHISKDGMSLVRHDLEEFLEVLRHHGLWKDDVKAFVEEGAHQMALPLGGAKKVA